MPVSRQRQCHGDSETKKLLRVNCEHIINFELHVSDPIFILK